MNNEIMTIKDVLKRWRLLLVSTIVFALLAFIVSAILPVKYQSDISVIVVQQQASEKVDAFSATKSAEFLSNIFTRVIYTTSFFNDVQNAPFEVKRNFSIDPEEREKQWKAEIDVKKVNNTGIINISVFDESRKTAEETAKAIAYVLTTKGERYHGGGDRVTVKLIDGPNTPLRPTVPNVLLNTTVGAIFGLIIALIVVYFFPDMFCLAPKKERGIDDSELNDEELVLDDEQDDELLNDFINDEKEGINQIQDETESTYQEDPELEELHNRIKSFNSTKE